MRSISDRLRLLFGRRANDASQTGVLRLGTSTFQAQTYTLPRVAAAVYSNPTGYRCIEMIANSLSRVEWEVYRPGTTEPIDDHALLDVLDSPAPRISGTQMQAMMGKDLVMTGRSAHLKMQGVDGFGDKGPVTGLRRLSPYRLVVLGNQDDELVGFVYLDRQGVRLPILADDVVYVHYPNPERYYDGIAPAVVAGLPAEIDSSAMRFNYDLLANDGALPGYISVKGLLPDQFQEWVTAWQSKEVPGKMRFLGGSGDASYVRVGAALSLDTPMPTPGGWTTMGSIREGDYLFDEAGKPCRVTFATEVMHDHECYDVHFSDGTVIRADADHRWRTWDQSAMDGLTNHRAGKTSVIHGAAVHTTAEIAATLHNARDVLNHRIEVAGALDTPDVPLPLDPYVLGAWLGDGHSTSASIYGGVDLIEVMAEVERRGYPLGATVTHYSAAKGTTAWRQSFGIVMDGTGRVPRTEAGTAILRRMGLHRNKHIPAAYLRASISQRLDLLRGLMDTDGTIDIHGHCRYSAKPEGLARQVFELVASLGMRPTLTLKATAYSVNFTPTTQVFCMARKMARYRPAVLGQVKWRVIRAVVPAPSVPVRCIQVDSPSHLFLAGPSMIPTHNTNQELAYDKLRDYSQKDICMALGVAYVLLNPTDATFANMTEARSGFWQDTLMPMISLENDQLTIQLGQAFGVDVGQKLDGIDELQEATDAVVDRNIKLLGVQATTINEVRDDLGMDPVKWGDEPIAPAAPMKAFPQSPVGEPTPALPPGGTPPPVPVPTVPVEAQPPQQGTRAIEAAVVKGVSVPDFAHRVEQFEKRMERRILAFFTRQGRVVEARVRAQSGKSRAKAVEQSTWWDKTRWDGELADDLDAIYSDTVDAFATDIVSRIGQGTFDPNAAAIRQYIEGRVQRDSVYINSTTADEVRSLIADHEANGESIAQIADAISGYFSGSDAQAAYRAETVARTEVISASNYGSLAGARASGVVESKTWLGTEGECPECAELDGETVPLDELFSSGDDAPGLHPRCRCTVTFNTTTGDTP